MIGAYPQSPKRFDGGVASAVTYLSQALISLPGIELIGVRISGQGDESREHSDFNWPVVDLSLGNLGLSTLYRRQKKRFRQLLDKYRPHIVHAQGTDLAGFLAVGSKLPAVVTVHGLLGACAKYQTDRVNKIRASLAALLTERRVVRGATDLIAISPFVTQYYKSEIRGRIHEIPNAIAPSFFQVKRHPERGRLLYAGRIANGKGLVELVHAIASSRGKVSKLILAGATPDKAYGNMLRAEIGTCALTKLVEFPGLLDESALLEEFAIAEALVLPSYQETAPMVIQQAMAAGLSVIATRIGGIPYQIEHDVTGLLFGAGNIAELAATIGRLADDASLSHRIGAAARAAAVARYQAPTIAEATFSVYRSMLSDSPIRAASMEAT